MNITQFTMEEVRCFAERQKFEIRPLTFLVGENSTGKTTALACFDILANYLTGGEIDFNSRPYLMGAFKDIVRNSRKKEKVFKLGFSFKSRSEKSRNENVKWTVEFIEKKGGLEPAIESITVKFTDGEIILRANDTRERRISLASVDKERSQYYLDMPSDSFEGSPLPFRLDRLAHTWEGQSEEENALANYLGEKRAHLRSLWGRIRRGRTTFSLSPIRAQPKRTYDPIRVFNDPEGSDIPTLLMEIKATDKKRWEDLKDQLIEFGENSGLFKNIDVRNYGRSRGNPFQLRVQVKGPNANIVDVGYGVSQILPILVHIFDRSVSRQRLDGGGEIPFFLLQQPEVHLHPRAQAALSSLLAQETHRGRVRRSFIIETHSDYMIDRARIEIRKGNIRPGDVSLIYLEPRGRVVKAHNISFDEMGNMKGVPPHYREFFMTEYRRLMGFKE